MKLLSIALILILAFLTQTSSAQSWVTMNPKPTAETINGVSFANADTGIIVCYEKSIFRTVDGGNQWLKFTPDAGNSYNDLWFIDVKFLNKTDAILLGTHNTIGRTDDCGETWSFQTGPTGPGVSLSKLYFVDELNGFICGWYNTLARTVDGGNSWELLSCDVYEQQMYTCMEFLNKDTGYIAGFEYYYPQEGRLFRTTDGGLSVEIIPLPAESIDISAIDVLSYDEIWLTEGQHDGLPRVYHTMDAGLTWETVFLGSYSDFGTGIKFFTPLKGRVTGGNSCFVTEDGGLTWSETDILASFEYPSFLDCDWVDENTAYVTGFKGFIAKTTNSGNQWQDKAPGSRAIFSSIAFTNSQTGCAVGYGLGADFIYHTADGGQTWGSALNYTVGDGWIYDIEYASENEVWAAGIRNRIYYSIDGGSSWTVFNPTDDDQSYFYSICPTNIGRVYAGGNTLIYSDDGGQSWQKNDFDCPGYYIRNIIFTNQQNGFLFLWEPGTSSTRSGKMFKTQDSGLTWEEIQYPSSDSECIMSADFINKDTGLISIHGVGIARTTNGGSSWDIRGYAGSLETLYLKMFTDNRALASNGYGEVYYSFDGGLTWEQVEISEAMHSTDILNQNSNIGRNLMQPEGIGGFFGICFTDMGSGWRCGDGGLIEKYTDLTVSIDEVAAEQPDAYRIYPSPASTFIQITGEKDPEFVSIVNSQGKCIQHYAGLVSKINVSRLPAGVYLMQITNSRRQQSLRFVKQ